MNRRAIPIGKQFRFVWSEIDGEEGVAALEPKFAGAIVLSDVTTGGIRFRLDMDGDSTQLEPHEARALGAALIAAADDVAAYKVKP
jgi:hypothetical protein